MGLTLTYCRDYKLLDAFIKLDEIWERYGHGNDCKSYQLGHEDGSHWLLVQDEGIVIGVFGFIEESDCAISIHPYLLKKQRHKARDMMHAFYRFFLSHISDKIVRIEAVIPHCYMSAINASKKTGLKLEGVLRQRYFTHGEIFDQSILSITREEVDQWVL